MDKQGSTQDKGKLFPLSYYIRSKDNGDGFVLNFDPCSIPPRRAKKHLKCLRSHIRESAQKAQLLWEHKDAHSDGYRYYRDLGLALEETYHMLCKSLVNLFPSEENRIINEFRTTLAIYFKEHCQCCPHSSDSKRHVVIEQRTGSQVKGPWTGLFAITVVGFAPNGSRRRITSHTSCPAL